MTEFNMPVCSATNTSKSSIIVRLELMFPNYTLNMAQYIPVAISLLPIG